MFQITSYLAILQLGLDFAGARAIAESIGKSDSLKANNVYWEVVRYNRYSAMFCAVIVAVATAALWYGIGVSSIPVGKLAASITLVAGSAQVIAFISRPYASALIGSQYLVIVNLISVGSTILTSLIAYILLMMGWGILCIPMAGLAISCISLLVLRWQTSLRCVWRTKHAPLSNSDVMKSIIGFGSLTSLGGIAWTIESTVDVMLLGAFIGPSAVAIYVLWWRFPNMIFSLCSSLVNSSFPSFAERHGQSTEEASNLLNKVSYLTVGIATLALIGISLLLPSFMHLWVGPDYSIMQGNLIAFGMGVLVSLRSYGNLLGMFWLASGQARFPTLLSWIQAVIKVGLAVLLVKPLGLKGVIIASCVASFVQVIVLAYNLYKRASLKTKTINHAIVLTSLALATSLSAIYGLELQLSLIGFLIVALLTSMIWSGLWLVFAWHSELRGSLEHLIRLKLNFSKIEHLVVKS
jgi:O-antigen/teichoic acid export membrane protein